MPTNHFASTVPERIYRRDGRRDQRPALKRISSEFPNKSNSFSSQSSILPVILMALPYYSSKIELYLQFLFPTTNLCHIIAI